MSRKQSGKPIKANRKYELERKRDERAARRALAKDKKNRPPGGDDGEEFINGTEKPSCRELHIAYRYGDHYDSVRKIGDNSESPAHLRIESLNNSRRFGDGQKEKTRGASPSRSLSEDEELILSILCADSQSDNLCQSSATSQTCHSDWLESEQNNQSSQRDCASGTHPLCQGMQAECSENTSSTEGSISHKPKLSNKQRKEQQRLEKKKRQEERHRQKVLQGRGSHDQNVPEAVTLVPALNTLSI
ncbi:hypothetical protein cypCar_00015336 [Cyprinus carpio]|nr:hypothetical protein cypCar_00015336 [Cyprinus carpio]